MLFLLAIIAGTALPSIDELWSKTQGDVLGSFSNARLVDDFVAYDFEIDGMAVATRFELEDGRVRAIQSRATHLDPRIAARVCSSMKRLIEVQAGPGAGETRWIGHAGQPITSCEQRRMTWKTDASEIAISCGPVEGEDRVELWRRLGLGNPRESDPYAGVSHLEYEIILRAGPLGSGNSLDRD